MNSQDPHAGSPRFRDALTAIHQRTLELIVGGASLQCVLDALCDAIDHDEMIPVSNSYRLSENLANAVLLTYPDAGHGSLFQYPESFTRHAAAFLSSDSESAAF